MPPSQAPITDAGMTSPSSLPLFRFGVVADPQYAAIEPIPALDRYPALSLDKLGEAIAEFNRHDLAFVVTLGDVIDGIWESFDAILPVYETLRHQHHILLGNHDFAVVPERLGSVVSRLGMPAANYDVVHAGHRFILLNGNAVSVHAYPAGDPRRREAEDWLARMRAEGAANGETWNAAIGEEQLAWLSRRLDAAKLEGERVIVMNHYPVYPPGNHSGWDSERIVELLSRHDHVAAYMNGHDHAGKYGFTGGTHYLNFKGMVDTADTNAYALVAVFPDRLQVTGFGREESRTLMLESLTR
jgi:predicted phosphodiesterase